MNINRICWKNDGICWNRLETCSNTNDYSMSNPIYSIVNRRCIAGVSPGMRGDLKSHVYFDCFLQGVYFIGCVPYARGIMKYVSCSLFLAINNYFQASWAKDVKCDTRIKHILRYSRKYITVKKWEAQCACIFYRTCTVNNNNAYMYAFLLLSSEILSDHYKHNVADILFLKTPSKISWAQIPNIRNNKLRK